MSASDLLTEAITIIMMETRTTETDSDPVDVKLFEFRLGASVQEEVMSDEKQGNADITRSRLVIRAHYTPHLNPNPPRFLLVRWQNIDYRVIQVKELHQRKSIELIADKGN